MLINNRSLKTSVAGICEMGSPRDTNRASKWYIASRKYPKSLSWDMLWLWVHH